MLIVFVFAAIIAIMLYREMPVTLFEAQRQKEQRLVDRGHEYVRAVQLFYRRNRGQYPSSIEQLESTNNIRYLRRRYTDPFTGKDDWRLLHAGPGGLLIDSKVQQTQLPGSNGQPGANTSTGGIGQNSATGQNSFGSSFSSGSNTNTNPNSSSSSSSSSDASVVVAPLPQRAPAIAANTAPGTGTQMPSSQTLDQNPDAPLLPPSTNDATQAGGGGAASPNRNAGTGNGQPNGGPGIMQTLNPVIGSGTTPPAQPGFGASQGSAGSTLGQMSGGGALAGVASKAKGRAIKVVNEQDDYSLWEFYYNPATDPTGRLTLGGAAPSAPLQTGAPGMSAPVNNNGSGTGNATPGNAAPSDATGSTPDNSSTDNGAAPSAGAGTNTAVPTSKPAPPQ